MLFILLLIFIIFIVIGKIQNNESLELFSWVFASTIFIVLIIVFAYYNNIKVASNRQISILEENNTEIMAYIEPITKKYLNYEETSLEKLRFNPSSSMFLGTYPELKGNEFFMKQISIVASNNEEIKNLKLRLATLESFKFWIFMGE